MLTGCSHETNMPSFRSCTVTIVNNLDLAFVKPFSIKYKINKLQNTKTEDNEDHESGLIKCHI